MQAEARRCAEPECPTILSRYNPSDKCFAHDKHEPVSFGAYTGISRSRAAADHHGEPSHHPPQEGTTYGATRKRIAEGKTLAVRQPESWVDGVVCPVGECQRYCPTWRSLQMHVVIAHDLVVQADPEGYELATGKYPVKG